MKTFFLILFCVVTPLIHAKDFEVSDEFKELKGYDDGLRTIWWSPDGEFVYGDYGSIIGWNLSSGDIVKKIEIPGYTVHPSCVNNDMTMWAQGNSNYSNPEKPDITDMYPNLNVYDFSRRSVYASRIEGYSIWKMCFIPETNWVYAIISDSKTYTNSLVKYDLMNRKIESTVVKSASSKDVMSELALSEDGKFLAVGYAGSNNRIEIYSTEENKFEKSFECDSEVSSLVIANNILAAGVSKSVVLVQLDPLKMISTITTNASAYHLAISPNGKTIALGSKSTGGDLIDIESGEVEHFYDGSPSCFSFSKDGQALAVGVDKRVHTAEIPSARVFFNKNKTQASPIKDQTLGDATVLENKGLVWNVTTMSSPAFEIAFPAPPVINEGTDKQGLKKIIFKSVLEKEGFLLNVNQLSAKTSEKSYPKVIDKAFEKFMSNMKVEPIATKEWDLGDGGSKGKYGTFEKDGFMYHYYIVARKGFIYQLTQFHFKDQEGHNQQYVESFKVL